MEPLRVSLAEAGRLLGVPTNTVRSRWKAGKLRGERDNSGRVFVWVIPSSEQRVLKPSSQPSMEGEVSALRDHIDTLRSELERVRSERDALADRAAEADLLKMEAIGLNAMVDTVTADRDFWRDEAKRVLDQHVRILEDQLQNAPPTRRGWWPFGRG